MKFFSVLSTLLLSSVAIAAPTPSSSVIEKRDTTSVLASIKSISSSITALNNSINSFQPIGLTTLGGVIDTLKYSDAVGTAILGAQKAINNSQPFNGDDSGTVALSVLGLVPQVESLLTNLVDQRSKFDKVALLFSVRKTFLSALQLDKTLTDVLAQAVGKKLTEAFASAVPFVQAELDGAFAKAITEYSTQRNGIELPAIPSKVQGDKVVNF